MLAEQLTGDPCGRGRPVGGSACGHGGWHGTVALDAMSLHFVYTVFMATETTTVRVRRPDSERLQLIARAREASVIDVVHDAIDALERREFLHGLGEDYQRLRSDPEEWERYVAERTEWDALA